LIKRNSQLLQATEKSTGRELWDALYFLFVRHKVRNGRHYMQTLSIDSWHVQPSLSVSCILTSEKRKWTGNDKAMTKRHSIAAGAVGMRRSRHHWNAGLVAALEISQETV
jgi:hypothetical protein